jgi:hypothetical protein
LDHLFRYFPLLFVALGLAIILGAVKGIVGSRRFVRRAQRVPGVVSDVRTSFVGRGEHLRARQRPVLTFTTLEGREITTEAATTSDLGVGNETEVLYDPDDPTRAVPVGNAGGGYGAIVAGLIAVVIGLAFFVGFAGFWGDGQEARCEVQQADGSFEPVECPDFDVSE